MPRLQILADLSKPLELAVKGAAQFGQPHRANVLSNISVGFYDLNN